MDMLDIPRRAALVAAVSTLLALTLMGGSVRAQDDLDVTITVIEEDTADVEREVTRRIELPPRARGEGTGERGTRDDAPGRDISRDARERGREFGQSTAEEARDRRGPPDQTGGGAPDNPGNGPPENPGDAPPDNPGGGQP